MRNRDEKKEHLLEVITTTPHKYTKIRGAPLQEGPLRGTSRGAISYDPYDVPTAARQ